MHLGRSIRMPAGLMDSGNEQINAATLQPLAAWRRAVDGAIALGVDCVLLSGDVVDGDAHFYTALAALEEGVRRLSAANIEVIGVAGNHDVGVLPRLADELPGFQLLGRGGEWEIRAVTNRHSNETLNIVGWSFPTKSVTYSPMPGLERLNSQLSAATGTVIGLLHCDLDSTGSSHAPVSRVELQRPGISAWLLGHIHIPNSSGFSGAQPIGYLGSLVGLDYGDTGWHGAWLLRAEDGNVTMERLDSAPLLWVRKPVGVDDAKTLDDVDSRIAACLRETHRENELSASAIGCRLELYGRTPILASLKQHTERVLETGAITYGVEPICFINDIALSNVRPALDLKAIASGAGPPAILARKIVSLESMDDIGTGLIAEARDRLHAQANRSIWRSIDAVTLSAHDIQSYLINSGELALDELLRTQSKITDDATPAAIGIGS